MSKVSK